MTRFVVGLGCLALALTAATPLALAAPGWLAPQTLSGEAANYSQVTTDPQGDAVAVWQRLEGGIWIAQVATRPAGGDWSAPTNISSPGQGVYAPQVAVDGAGNAIAVWQALDDDYFNYAVQAVTRPAGGDWSVPVNLSPTGENSELAQVSTNSHGDAAVVWERVEAGQHIARAVTRPAGGSWSAPASLSAAGPVTLRPQIAVDGAGDAVAAWERYDGSDFRIEAATRTVGGGWSAPASLSAAGRSGANPDLAAGLEGGTVATWRRRNDGTLWVAQSATHSSGGGWSAPTSLSAMGQPAYFPQVSANGAGAAVAVWYRYDGSVYAAQSATHSSGGGWSAPANLSSPGEEAVNPKVAVDSEGNAVAVWEHPVGSSYVIQAAGYDATGPQLAGLSIPAQGRAGVPVAFAVSPLDIWSGLGGTTWSFGDGATATGVGVEHAYARAGAYGVTVTAADSLGNPTTAAATIAIAAGRAHAARLAEVKRGRARLKLRCREGNCAGFVKLTAREVLRRPGRGAKIRRVALGGSAFAIANGKAKVVEVKLRGRAGKLIRSAGKKRLKVRLGGSGVEGRAVTLKPTAKSRHGHRSRRNGNRSGGKR